ncbi:hypothetical protein [Streptomyces vinaceus]|uniref:hypothetical protein n=1 Tax=Streptomyces vinaceus TaxID=1960 RepID=UPI00381871EC
MTAMERARGDVTARPTRAGIVRVWAGSLAAVAVRRRAGPGVRHSAELRQLVLALAASEVIAAALLSTMLPPGVRPVHATLELLLILAGLGLVAAVARHPHGGRGSGRPADRVPGGRDAALTTVYVSADSWTGFAAALALPRSFSKRHPSGGSGAPK